MSQEQDNNSYVSRIMVREALSSDDIKLLNDFTHAVADTIIAPQCDCISFGMEKHMVVVSSNYDRDFTSGYFRACYESFAEDYDKWFTDLLTERTNFGIVMSDMVEDVDFLAKRSPCQQLDKVAYLPYLELYQEVVRQNDFIKSNTFSLEPVQSISLDDSDIMRKPNSNQFHR